MLTEPCAGVTSTAITVGSLVNISSLTCTVILFTSVGNLNFATYSEHSVPGPEVYPGFCKQPSNSLLELLLNVTTILESPLSIGSLGINFVSPCNSKSCTCCVPPCPSPFKSTILLATTVYIIPFVS